MVVSRNEPKLRGEEYLAGSVEIEDRLDVWGDEKAWLR
jgi:hypothetical protein